MAVSTNTERRKHTSKQILKHTSILEKIKYIKALYKKLWYIIDKYFKCTPLHFNVAHYYCLCITITKTKQKTKNQKTKSKPNQNQKQKETKGG